MADAAVRLIREHAIDRVLTLEIVRVTERAAMAAAAVRGRGDERLAEQSAGEAMRAELNRLGVSGRIVIGEGDPDGSSTLHIGEQVGAGNGPEVDIGVDPLEGTTICAKNLPNSLSVIAVTQRGGLLNVPDIYMDKIAIGPGFPEGLVDLDMPPQEAIELVAREKGVRPRDVSACVLDRPRNARLVEAVRSTGAAIRLIGDGDVAGVIHTTDPDVTGIDIYLGSGGAPEGVLAAAALRCMGGQICGRLLIDSDDKRARAERIGISDFRRVYRTADMAAGDVLFAATGVTDGNLLDGVTFNGDSAVTHTLVARSYTGTQRWVKARHRMGERAGSAD
jgi:fructose-1,6-bisphosphatase II / sedoheptulose-1,7-bisphosphatase